MHHLVLAAIVAIAFGGVATITHHRHRAVIAAGGHESFFEAICTLSLVGVVYAAFAMLAIAYTIH